MTNESGPTVVEHGLESIFRSEYRSLVRLARLLVDDVGDAEEVVQEAFLALHRSWDRAADPVAYVRTCVVNGARGRLRRRATARRHLRVAEPEDQPVLDAGAIRDEEAKAVAAALAALPDRQRACIALRFYTGLSEAETASTLGISTGSVKTHVHRGLATLGHRLEALR